MLKSVSSNHLICVNPANNYVGLGKVKISTDKEIILAVIKSQKAKRIWKEMGIKKRITILRNIFGAFFAKKEELIKIIIAETGKTIRFEKSEFDRHSVDFAWFLDNSEKFLNEKVTFEDAKTIHRIIYEPRGVTAVITPWNHPYGMFVWGVIPNLVAGNTVVYKASEECPLSGQLIEEIIKFINRRSIQKDLAERKLKKE